MPRDADAPIILKPSAPLISAQRMVQRNFHDGIERTLQHQQDTFYSWRCTRYVEETSEEMKALIYHFLSTALRPTEQGGTAPFDPNKSKVANVLEALAATTQISHELRAPAWLDGREDHPPASEIIACKNGLLHLPTQALLAHSPAFFGLNSLPFPYDPLAYEPEEWMTFLGQLWPNDQPSIDALQELFGLLLTNDVSHQKIFMLIGPKRSGKGTIARILTKLLGQENVCGPTLGSLGQNFGLQPLVGKLVAIISDARIGTKTDHSVIVERLLAISGEDSLTVDRKYKEPWTGRLGVRFVLLSNELPRLIDSSGAMASRIVILKLNESFYGREDHSLTDRLSAELPGIMNWAIEGWKRLQARGHFLPPASGLTLQQALDDLSSPIGAFLREQCEVKAGAQVECGILFDAWVAWCRENNRDHPGTTQGFSRDLHSAVPGLDQVRPRDASGGRQRCYEGVRLLPCPVQPW